MPVHRLCRLTAFGLALAMLGGGVACSSSPPAAQPPVMAADSGSVMSGDFRLSYIAEGAGRPALVVGSALYYARVFSPNLRHHLRLVFMDHRGFAPSPGVRDTTAFALDTLLDDMERVRAALDLGPVVVVGHSGHAFLALEYAKRYPAHVSHVVMVGMAPDLGPASTEARDAYWERTATEERKAILQENRRQLPDEEIARLPVSPGRRFIRTYIRDAPQAWYDPRFDSSPLWDGVDINMDMFGYVWGRIFRDIDITRGLATFDRPVLVALGRHDYLIAPPASWDPVRPRFRDLTLRIFEQSGHTPPYEEPAAFDEQLVAWLNR